MPYINRYLAALRASSSACISNICSRVAEDVLGGGAALGLEPLLGLEGWAAGLGDLAVEGLKIVGAWRILSSLSFDCLPLATETETSLPFDPCGLCSACQRFQMTALLLLM